jgi:hypothetical protein
MPLAFTPTDTTEPYDDPALPKVRLRHTSHHNRVLGTNATLFKPSDIELSSIAFDFRDPGDGTSDTLLASQSPGLVAFRNVTAKISRPSSGHRNKGPGPPLPPARSQAS